MKLSPAPFRQPLLDENGLLTRPWQEWCGEVQRVIASLPTITTGANSPNGVIAGVVGDLRTRTNGGAVTTLYVKESGAGTTAGWIAK